MKQSTYTPIASSLAQTTSTSTTVASVALHAQASAFLASTDTNDGRITFDGTTPTSTVGHLLPKGQPPQLFLVGNGATIKCLSNAVGNCVLTVTSLQ